MGITGPITLGMPVYGCDTRPIGPVEGLGGEGIRVRGHQIPGAAIARVTGGAVHLRLAGGALLAPRPVGRPHRGAGRSRAANRDRPAGAGPDGAMTKGGTGPRAISARHTVVGAFDDTTHAALAGAALGAGAGALLGRPEIPVRASRAGGHLLPVQVGGDREEGRARAILGLSGAARPRHTVCRIGPRAGTKESVMPDGTISTLRPNRGDGYGFGSVTPDGGGPALVFYRRGVEGTLQAMGRLLHNLRHAATSREQPFDRLRVGQRVTFAVGEDGSQAGRAYAERVRPSEDCATTARSGGPAATASQ